MQIHHLNCGTFCPFAARLISGRGSYFKRGKMVCHCLLIETPQDGLILVDSGFGTADCQTPSRVHASLRIFARPVMSVQETAINQVQALGFKANDVRHIVLTHMDLDHAGGLADFPQAKVHVHQSEYDAAFSRRSSTEKRRYLPAQWAHGPDWQTYSEYGDDWFGLEAVRQLHGVRADVAIVPLTGHTQGHSGIAAKAGEQWFLHAGDAYFYHGQLQDPQKCPAALQFFQKTVAENNRDRVVNVQRLYELHSAQNDGVNIFSAHDPVEYDELREQRKIA